MPEVHDEVEPIDVLLEEVMAEPSPALVAYTRRAEFWRRVAVAAVAMLGLGAVIGVLVMRRMQEAAPKLQFAAPMQGKDDLVPKDRAEFERLLGTASAIRFVRKEIVGATRDDPASEHLDFEAWPEALEVTGDELGEWRKAIAASKQADKWSGVEVTMDAEVLLPAGKKMTCFITFAEKSTANQFAHFSIGDEKQLPLIPNGELLGKLRATNEAIEARHRRANGMARTFAELAEMPVEARRIDCPVGEVKALRAQLERFPKLRQLRLRQGKYDGAVPFEGHLLSALADLPLTQLDLDATCLTDGDLLRLGSPVVGAVLAGDDKAKPGALPSLNSLILRHGGQRLTGSGLAALNILPVSGVAFHDCCGLTPSGMAALSKLPRLRELILSRITVEDFGATIESLRGCPSLTTLVVRSEQFTDSALGGLRESKLRDLILIDSPVTGEGLARLADLPSLIYLQLTGTGLGDADIPSLARWTSLKGLQLDNSRFTSDGVQALHEAMPKCSLRIHPERRLLDTFLALPRHKLDLRD